MKILITGGHLTPALALIEELRTRGREIVYIGRISSFGDGSGDSVEENVVSKLRVTYYGFNPVKLQRNYNLNNLLSLPQFPLTVVRAASILRREKPAVVMSFGGYVAVPFAVAASMQGIPVVTHEQTAAVGLANKIISHFAAKVAISWTESAQYFPPKKTVLTGNLVRSELLAVAELQFLKDAGTLYITGGNQGSHVINQTIEKIITELLLRFTVYHQVGNAPVYGDFDRLTALKGSLAIELQNRYHLAKWFDTEEVAAIYRKASIIVGRSGANTVAEVAALGKVALFIPLSGSSHNEQEKNARLLQTRGSAMIINQDDIDGQTLLHKIKEVASHYTEFASHAQENKSLIPKDAARKLADVVESVVKNKPI